MLNIPASMQPTLDKWKQKHSLGEGMKFGLDGNGANLAAMMDQVTLADNNPAQDSDNAKGVLVCKDDGETWHYQGDSKVGSAEAVGADGSVNAFQFSEQSVEHLQLTQKPDGVEALHEHFDRSGGHGYMQVGGAITVIDMDANPDALSEILLGSKPAPPAPNPKAQKVGQDLAGKLGVDASAVKPGAIDEAKGFNASNCGFAVNGEMQMSAWTQGLEVKLECNGEKYVFRGLDEKTGRFALDAESPTGYWKEDERGIYVPDTSVPADNW